MGAAATIAPPAATAAAAAAAAIATATAGHVMGLPGLGSLVDTGLLSLRQHLAAHPKVGGEGTWPGAGEGGVRRQQQQHSGSSSVSSSSSSSSSASNIVSNSCSRLVGRGPEPEAPPGSMPKDVCAGFAACAL